MWIAVVDLAFNWNSFETHRTLGYVYFVTLSDDVLAFTKRAGINILHHNFLELHDVGVFASNFAPFTVYPMDLISDESHLSSDRKGGLIMYK